MGTGRAAAAGGAAGAIATSSSGEGVRVVRQVVEGGLGLAEAAGEVGLWCFFGGVFLGGVIVCVREIVYKHIYQSYTACTRALRRSQLVWDHETSFKNVTTE